MTKTEIINEISENSNASKIMCEQIVDAFFEKAKECILNDEKVSVRGFGTFDLSSRPERNGRNPKTNEIVHFPAVKTIRWKPSKNLKKELNGRV